MDADACQMSAEQGCLSERVGRICRPVRLWISTDVTEIAEARRPCHWPE